MAEYGDSSVAYGPVESSARAMVASLSFETGTPEHTLAETAVAMAIVTDKATAKGSAVAAAASALQLRQAITDIRTILQERNESTDEFANVMESMLRSVS